MSNERQSNWRRVVFLMTCLALCGSAFAAKVADVRATLHNLSAQSAGTPTSTGSVPTRTVYATSETQVCVFCHTPHGGQQASQSPLWNRTFSAATYITYQSTSMDALAPTMAGNEIAGTLDQPGGSSKLCLSCHDGTLAIGTVGVANGQTPVTISMIGTGTGGVIPSGSGATTGNTRNLGQNLTNDHPISVTYTAALANRDGAMRPVHVKPLF